MTADVRIRLAGGGGEPVDLWRTFMSHGVADLPPTRIDEHARILSTTIPVAGGRPRFVTVAADGTRHAVINIAGRAPGSRTSAAVVDVVRHVLRMDEDLSDFYAATLEDPELAWVASGAGRMIRSPTVFEDVIKTICTTNCAWSATQRMVTALVEHLGEPGVGTSGPDRRAFPTPEAMAAARPAFYKNVVRAGYRGAYLQTLARSVARGEIDLEGLATTSSTDLSDDEVEEQLLELPGVGPYAAAHIMMMLGRYSRLILDSWSRPTYARVAGKKKVSDATIIRRFRPYGGYAGLAFWLYITRHWVDD